MTVYKLIQVVGTSGTSIDDAIRGAIGRAGSSVEDLRWFEVKEIRGRIDHSDSVEFQVHVDIGFHVHAPRNVEKEKARRREKAPTRQARSQAAQLVARKGGRKRSDIARNFQKQRSK